jgi:DNA-binding CsgD family transcriptional regulator
MNRTLSKRQKQIVDLLMQDYSSKEIASILGLKTTHTSNYLDRARKNFG